MVHRAAVGGIHVYQATLSPLYERSACSAASRRPAVITVKSESRRRFGVVTRRMDGDETDSAMRSMDAKPEASAR